MGSPRFLTFKQIVDINYLMYTQTGGLWQGEDNLKDPGSLQYIVEMIQGSVMGHDPFPTIIDKAAALGHRIISGHYFWDGNKRTGIEAAKLFLEINGYTMYIEMDSDTGFDTDAESMALKTADGKVSEEDFKLWLSERTKP